MDFDLVLLVIATLLGLSVVASQASAKLGIPSLLLFLGVGMLAGSDGVGGIYFNDPHIAQSTGVVALVFILFSGGMDTDWRSVRPQVGPALSLATFGVLISTILVGIAAVLFLKFSVFEALLLGSIIASTDAAAVFAALRGTNLNLPPRISAIIEIESGSNDPTAVLLTVTFTSLILGQSEPGFGLVFEFAFQMAIGGMGGYLFGYIGNWLIRHIHLKLYAMNQIFSIVIALGAYALTAALGGNGFLAVYVAGLSFSHSPFSQLKGLRRFHDGIAWLMQIAMFLVLGLFVFPSQLPAIAASGLLIGLVLMLIARPLSVACVLTPFRFDLRSQALVSWAGLRGAVPIVLATFPLITKLERAQEIFNIVFFVVLISSLIQGTTLRAFAKHLNISDPKPDTNPA